MRELFFLQEAIRLFLFSFMSEVRNSQVIRKSRRITTIEYFIQMISDIMRQHIYFRVTKKLRMKVENLARDYRNNKVIEYFLNSSQLSIN